MTPREKTKMLTQIESALRAAEQRGYDRCLEDHDIPKVRREAAPGASQQVPLSQNEQAWKDLQADDLRHAAKLLALSLTDAMLDSLRADYGHTNVAVLRHWRGMVLESLDAVAPPHPDFFWHRIGR